jgi:hypothetical protein
MATAGRMPALPIATAPPTPVSTSPTSAAPMPAPCCSPTRATSCPGRAHPLPTPDSRATPLLCMPLHHLLRVEACLHTEASVGSSFLPSRARSGAAAAQSRGGEIHIQTLVREHVIRFHTAAHGAGLGSACALVHARLLFHLNNRERRCAPLVPGGQGVEMPNGRFSENGRGEAEELRAGARTEARGEEGEGEREEERAESAWQGGRHDERRNHPRDKSGKGGLAGVKRGECEVEVSSLAREHLPASVISPAKMTPAEATAGLVAGASLESLPPALALDCGAKAVQARHIDGSPEANQALVMGRSPAEGSAGSVAGAEASPPPPLLDCSVSPQDSTFVGGGRPHDAVQLDGPPEADQALTTGLLPADGTPGPMMNALPEAPPPPSWHGCRINVAWGMPEGDVHDPLARSRIDMGSASRASARGEEGARAQAQQQMLSSVSAGIEGGTDAQAEVHLDSEMTGGLTENVGEASKVSIGDDGGAVAHARAESHRDSDLGAAAEVATETGAAAEQATRLRAAAQATSEQRATTGAEAARPRAVTGATPASWPGAVNAFASSPTPATLLQPVRTASLEKEGSASVTGLSPVSKATPVPQLQPVRTTALTSSPTRVTPTPKPQVAHPAQNHPVLHPLSRGTSSPDSASTRRSNGSSNGGGGGALVGASLRSNGTGHGGGGAHHSVGASLRRRFGWDAFVPEIEWARLRPERWGGWRRCSANATYALCASYPRDLIVPASVTDGALGCAARFRSKERVPALTWIDPRTGAALCRSSQPLVRKPAAPELDRCLILFFAPPPFHLQILTWVLYYTRRVPALTWIEQRTGAALCRSSQPLVRKPAASELDRRLIAFSASLLTPPNTVLGAIRGE